MLVLQDVYMVDRASHLKQAEISSISVESLKVLLDLGRQANINGNTIRVFMVVSTNFSLVKLTN